MEQNLEKKIDELGRDLKKVITLLQGNDLDKSDTGMIGQVDDIDRRLTKLERMVVKGVWLIIGGSIGAGWAISDLIVKIFK